jgi:hypothetical protein
MRVAVTGGGTGCLGWSWLGEVTLSGAMGSAGRKGSFELRAYPPVMAASSFDARRLHVPKLKLLAPRSEGRAK